MVGDYIITTLSVDALTTRLNVCLVQERFYSAPPAELSDGFVMMVLLAESVFEDEKTAFESMPTHYAASGYVCAVPQQPLSARSSCVRSSNMS